MIPPIIKTLIWRLIRRALATAERATRFSTNGNNRCDKCNMLENGSHLFFHCVLPTQVWLSATPYLNIATLPQEVDGIQNILHLLINDNTPDTILCKTLYILWYIWKARNDYCFNRKEWSPIQVHKVVESYMAHLELNSPQTSVSFSQPIGMQSPVLQVTNSTSGGNQYFCSNLVFLQGSRCYVDVSIALDNHNINTNVARLGMFILNF